MTDTALALDRQSHGRSGMQLGTWDGPLEKQTLVLQERFVSGAWEPCAPVGGVALHASQPRGSSHGAVQGEPKAQRQQRAAKLQ